MKENYRIQELIETKSFDELSPEEKALVLSEITEEDYTTRKSVVDNTRAFLSEGVRTTKTDDHIKQRAALILNEKQKQEKTWVGAFLQYKIPAFIPAAAAVLLLLILPFAFKGSSVQPLIAQNKDTVQRIVYKTDTVVLEKQVIKQVNVPVVKYITKTTLIPSSVSAISNQGSDRVVTTDPAIIINNTKNQLKKHSTQIGLSSGDTRAFDALIKMNDTIMYEP